MALDWNNLLKSKILCREVSKAIMKPTLHEVLEKLTSDEKYRNKDGSISIPIKLDLENCRIILG